MLVRVTTLKRYWLAKGKFDAVSVKIQKDLKLKPLDPALHCALGDLYKGIGNLGDAIRQYKKALSIQPTFIQALKNLTTVYVTKEEYDKAVSIFMKIVEYRPNSAGAYYNIACLYAMQNSTEESIDWLKKAIEKGYKSWDLIKTDKNLKNIRASSWHRELLRGR